MSIEINLNAYAKEKVNQQNNFDFNTAKPQRPFKAEAAEPIRPEVEARQALNELKAIQYEAGVSLRYDDKGRAWLRFNPPLNHRDEDKLDKAEYAYSLFKKCYHLLD